MLEKLKMTNKFLEFLYRNPVRIYLFCALGGFALAVSIFYVRVNEDIDSFKSQLEKQLEYNVIEFNQRYQTIETQLGTITSLATSLLDSKNNGEYLANSNIVNSWRLHQTSHFRHLHGSEKYTHRSVEVLALNNKTVASNDNIQRNNLWFEKELGMTEHLWSTFPFLYNSSPYIERVYYTSYSAMTAIYPRLKHQNFFSQLEEKFELGLSLPFYTSGNVSENPSQKNFITDIYKDPISGEQTITIGMPLVLNNTHLGNFGIDFNINQLADLLPQSPGIQTALVLDTQNSIYPIGKSVPKNILEITTQLNGKSGVVTKDKITVIYRKMELGIGTTILWLPTEEIVSFGLASNYTLFLAVFSVGVICFAIGLIAIKAALNHLKGTLKKLDEIAHSDELTQIANRRSFIDFAEDEYARACRHETSFALILLDLDNFKKINDSHGHLAGDAVLKAFCGVLSHAMSKTDLFARWGGEEFIVLPSTHENVLEQAETMRKAVENSHFPYAMNVTVSIGVVLCHNTAKYSKNSLFELADSALYRAKESGRNNVVFIEV